MRCRALLLSALYVATAERSSRRRLSIPGSSRTQEHGLPGPVPHSCPCSPRPRKRGTLHDSIRVYPLALLLHQHHNRPRTDDVLGPEHLLLLPRLTDVVRRILTGVDDPVPGLVEAVDDRENQRLSESVDHDVQILIAPARAFQVISEALGVVGEIGGGAYPSPTDVIAPEAATTNAGMRFAERNHQPPKAEEASVFMQPGPIQ